MEETKLDKIKELIDYFLDGLRKILEEDKKTGEECEHYEACMEELIKK